MKLHSVSLLCVLLAACQEDPLAPVPRLPRAPQDAPVVITGRIVSSASTMGVQAANVRVTEAKASVGTDEGGRYRIVLPARFRGQMVPVSIRAIGFKALTRSVRLDSDSVTLDAAMAAEAFQFHCELVIIAEAYGTPREPGVSVNMRPATKVMGVVRAGR